MEFKHISVMLEECMNGLNIKDGGVYFDGTLGLAGHTKEILKRGNNVKVIATDLDTEELLHRRGGPGGRRLRLRHPVRGRL